MAANLWIAASAGIVGLLGAGHVLLTYLGPKMLPRDAAVRAAMEGTSLVITPRTTMWRAWIGFNVSHSLGAILFGLVYGYLAIAHPALLAGSTFLLALGVSTLAIYAVLARLYWFATPLAGVCAALVFFLIGLFGAAAP